MHGDAFEFLQRLLGRPMQINPLWEIEHEQLLMETMVSYLMHHYYTAEEAYDYASL